MMEGIVITVSKKYRLSNKQPPQKRGLLLRLKRNESDDFN